MAYKKKLKELTLKDNFLFGAVMMDEDNCKGFLERALEFPIDRVEVSREKSIVYHPEYKGVRLDVFARDEHNTRYNVEMQVAKKEELGKRARYYHSQIDMELLLSGSEYKELPKVYVIFICNFDPFAMGKYRYTLTTQCQEDPRAEIGDGTISVFLSTAGENANEVPKELVTFLNFVKADLSESEANFEDDFVRRLQESIRRVKSSREMEERFMIFEEMLRDERAEGRAEGLAEGRAEGLAEGRAEGLAEGRAEGLAEGKAEGKAQTQIWCILTLLKKMGEVPENLQSKILNETDLNSLEQWFQLSLQVASVEEFLEKM